MMNFVTENKDMYSAISTPLKNMGLKVPKFKAIKSSVPKKDKSPLQSETQMFGISLSKQEWTHEFDYPIPKFLAVSTAYLTEFSRVEGIFRKSGSITRQRRLRIKLRNGESLEGSDPNDVASLLKQWLRELPEPLIPHCMHDLFVRCWHLDNEDRFTACLLSCLLLPPEHLYSLKHLLSFLKNLAMHASDNKMDIYNLALIIAPNIFTSRTGSISKTCLVQLHASMIKFLIENADRVGEFPESVSQHYKLDGRRSSDFESSAGTFDSGSCKLSRKLKTKPVQGIFSEIKKFVGQNTIATPNLKTLTPETSWTSPEIACRPVSLKDAEKTSSTLKDRVMEVLEIKSKTGNKRAHWKSFGLLRPIDRRRKSTSTSPQTKRDLSISRSSNFSSEIASNRMNSTFRVLTPTNESTGKSPAVEFEYDELNYKNGTHSTEYNLAPSPAKNYLSIPTSPNCSYDSPYVALYWLQTDKNFETKQWKTFDCESFYEDVENNINKSKTVKELEDVTVKSDLLDQLKLSYQNHNSVSVSRDDQRLFSNSGISPSNGSTINPQVFDTPKFSLSRIDCNESIAKIQKSNHLSNTDPKTNLSKINLKNCLGNTWKSKQATMNYICKPLEKVNSDNTLETAQVIQETCFVKSKNKETNTAQQLKNMDISDKNTESHVNLNYSKSFLVEAKWNQDEGKSHKNAKVSKKTTRLSSLTRGKPNAIQNLPPSQHLNKNLVTQSLKINYNKNSNESNSISFEIDPSTDANENENFFTEQDTSFILNLSNLNLPSMRTDDTSNRYNESFEVTVPKESSTPNQTALYAETLNKEQLPRERSTGHSRIPVLSRKKLHLSGLEMSLNDNNTLNCNEFNSPDSTPGMSGDKYFSMNSPQEGSRKKRKSIALILKNNSGHVLKKIEFYNSYDAISSTIAVNNKRKVSSLEKPPHQFSQKQLPISQSNRKTLSVSQSCNITAKRISVQSKVRNPLKLPCNSPKSSISLKALSPNTSPPLKEVGNISFKVQKNMAHNSTHLKNHSSPQKSKTITRGKCCNRDFRKIKLKRSTSFSWYTPPRSSKRVSRSQSSPSCPRPGTNSFKLIQESTVTSLDVPVFQNNVGDSSFSPIHLISYQILKKSGSSLSVRKLKTDEMMDEWQCEF